MSQTFSSIQSRLWRKIWNRSELLVQRTGILSIVSCLYHLETRSTIFSAQATEAESILAFNFKKSVEHNATLWCAAMILRIQELYISSRRTSCRSSLLLKSPPRYPQESVISKISMSSILSTLRQNSTYSAKILAKLLNWACLASRDKQKNRNLNFGSKNRPESQARCSQTPQTKKRLR